MSLLLPRRIQDQMAYNRQQARREREGLLDSVLPAPTHPRAKPRALATSALAIFFLLVIYMAATEYATSAKEKKEIWEPAMQRWVWESGVEMGEPRTEEQQAQSQNGELEAVDESESSNHDNEETDGEDDKVETEMKSGLAKYVWHEDLEWDADGSGRLIIVGDVHGMINQLKAFLLELDYSPDQTRHHNDTLVFVGDLVAKHPDIKSSLDTVKYIRSLNAYSVRGNHDQAVLDWRAWMERSKLEGLGTNEDVEVSSSSAAEESEDRESPEDVPQVLKHKWRDEHFRIAKSMSQASADWLAKRSMTLHIRSLHAYVVHAGLLPWTIPKNKGKKKKVHTQNKDGIVDEEEQSEGEPVDLDFLSDLDFTNEFGITEETPLSQSSSESSFIPVTPSSTPTEGDLAQNKKKDLDPEIAILTVPLNRKPFTLLEMRGLKKNGKVTKSTKKGEPWAPIWNQVMKGCQQSIDNAVPQEGTDVVDADKMKAGQCRPLSVIYGHAAARGLDLHPYSFGLDSGAVYGRSFSALVVNGKSWKNGHVTSKKINRVDVAVAGRHAAVYSMKTKQPKE